MDHLLNTRRMSLRHLATAVLAVCLLLLSLVLASPVLAQDTTPSDLSTEQRKIYLLPDHTWVEKAISVGTDGLPLSPATASVDIVPPEGSVTTTGATYSSGTVTFTANSQGVVFDTAGYGALSFMVSTAGTATVAAYVSDSPSGPWLAVETMAANNTGLATTTAVLVNTNYQYTINTLGRYVRIATTAYTSTFSLKPMLRGRAYPSKTVYAIIPALPTGANTIGATIGASWFTDTATPLAANATFTGTQRDLGATATTVPWSYFGGSFIADQAGTAILQFSTDTVTWTNCANLAVAANTAVDISCRIRNRYYRVLFVNGSTLQTVFRVSSSFTAN